MSERIVAILLGGVFLLTGHSIQKDGGFSHRNVMWVDFSGMEQPVSYVFYVTGIIFLFLSFKLKNDSIFTNYICPSCEKIYKSKQKCPDCGLEVVKLKGFYDRHSENKNN